jgi:hypothetical protein
VGLCNGFLLHGASGATLGSSGIAPEWALFNLGASLQFGCRAPHPRGYEALSLKAYWAHEAFTLSGSSHEDIRPYAPALISSLPHPRRKRPLTLMAQGPPPRRTPGEGALAGLPGQTSCLEERALISLHPTPSGARAGLRRPGLPPIGRLSRGPRHSP